jgi:hypothetical protein
VPTLENNRLVFRFPQIEENARFSVDFQRTLRIPDSEQSYSLPRGSVPSRCSMSLTILENSRPGPHRVGASSCRCGSLKPCG